MNNEDLKNKMNIEIPKEIFKIMEKYKNTLNQLSESEKECIKNLSSEIFGFGIDYGIKIYKELNKNE